jgi:hypothetical protein
MWHFMTVNFVQPCGLPLPTPLAKTEVTDDFIQLRTVTLSSSLSSLLYDTFSNQLYPPKDPQFPINLTIKIPDSFPN